MTVTAEAGLTLGVLQAELARHRQWLPVDPPHAARLTLRELLDHDWSGPRRFGHGTVREHLIGMKVRLADGRVIKSGGRVVKNVAGYDLAKLFLGAHGSLGTITEATFKLRPRPEEEKILRREVAELDEAKAAWRAVAESELTPVILDAHRGVAGPLQIVLGLAGTRAEVEWQRLRAESLGFTHAATLDYETIFWSDAAAVHRWSVLPSRLTEALAALGERPFVARAGNGTIYHRGEIVGPAAVRPEELMRRVKGAYDPGRRLPEFPA
jgi:FAD/FMN-containing dehydrogenase